MGLANPYVKLLGSVANGKRDEQVTVEAKECGLKPFVFRSAVATRSVDGGQWSADAFIRTTTTFRATWGDAVSVEVTVRVRAGVELQRLSPRLFEVRAGGVQSFWRKRVTIERLDRRLGTWSKVRTVVLGQGPSSTARYRTDLPKGTLIRALVPAFQAKPCYLAGTSTPVRI